ncbi:MAG: isoprenylcysteine carboxylmethyltransferase family protein [Chloroflexi bacterium]|nr:isoprenylcysteine carboxylmethyltransferase family protein [Chloroflexota bacterium]
MLKVILFAVATAFILFISRASLRAPGSHGFYRFFAWECILTLFLLNYRRWFYQPLAFPQAISWPLLLISLYLAYQGFSMLRRRGAPDEARRDATLLGLEKTTTLVVTGVYRYIRHPLYASLLFLAWGVFFKDTSWPALALTAAASLFLALTARAEETENMRFFGDQYREYEKRTRMFVPFLF